MKKYYMIVNIVFCLTILALGAPKVYGKSKNMGEVERVSVKEAREKTKAGKALLVCAYDDATCSDMVLDGSLLRGEFESKLDSISKNQEIIFYCA
jgi:hypothetical protein